MTAVKAPPDATFAKLNERFHAAYDRRRAELETSGPVLVVLGDSLFAFHGAAQRERGITPPSVHLIKATAHAPVAIYAALQHTSEGELDAATKATARALLANATSAATVTTAASPDGDVLDESQRSAVDEVLTRCARYLSGLLATNSFTRRELAAFAGGTGPALLHLTELATRVQLAALHAAVEAELGLLGEKERSALEIVVAGAHQARVRNLPLQYFRARLGEAPGEEARLTYAESVDDAAAARALVGTRRLDREIATAFFGDARRLQRDVLGDAAAELLASASFLPMV